MSVWEASYFGEVFDRSFPEPLPRWDDESERGADMWATEHETSAEVVDRYRRVWEHADATINSLAIDAPGHVPWWPRPDVILFNILVHMLTETSRHAGHADILREQLDGTVGLDAASAAQQQKDAAFWASRRVKIERAARAAEPEARRPFDRRRVWLFRWAAWALGVGCGCATGLSIVEQTGKIAVWER